MASLTGLGIKVENLEVRGQMNSLGVEKNIVYVLIEADVLIEAFVVRPRMKEKRLVSQTA